jgi:5'-deoxynucleotidase YfbR-like HD superfamily hydrolase
MRKLCVLNWLQTQNEFLIFKEMTYLEKLTEELEMFPNREKNLRAVSRYSLYPIMFYRTNLWNHSRRVAWIVEKLLPFAKRAYGTQFDDKKTLALSLVHDDAEMLFGDIQAGNKEKMTPDELFKIKQTELLAIEKLASISPKNIDIYNYRDLLIESVDKTSLESMIVNWADKFDAFGEALHEIFSGNVLWTKNAVNEYGVINLPTDYYMNFFKNFRQKFSRSAILFEQENSLFKIPEDIDIYTTVVDKNPHTYESLKKETGYLPYDFWVTLTLENGTEEDISHLCTKIE